MKNKPSEEKKGKLLEQVRRACRLKHLSPRTEKAYVGWIRRYVYFHGLRHPTEMGAAEVRLSHLAVDRRVAASTQNQALNALVFLYKAVPGRDLEETLAFERAQRPACLPVVLAPAEGEAVLDHLSRRLTADGRPPTGDGRSARRSAVGRLRSILAVQEGRLL